MRLRKKLHDLWEEYAFPMLFSLALMFITPTSLAFWGLGNFIAIWSMIITELIKWFVYE